MSAADATGNEWGDRQKCLRKGNKSAPSPSDPEPQSPDLSLMSFASIIASNRQKRVSYLLHVHRSHGKLVCHQYELVTSLRVTWGRGRPHDAAMLFRLTTDHLMLCGRRTGTSRSYKVANRLTVTNHFDSK